MNQIIKIGKVLDPLQFEEYIAEAEELETVIHKYGSNFNVPDEPCWMSYSNEGGTVGSISFTRHTYRHPTLSNMVDKIIEALTPIFPSNILPKKERVHFIRTKGSIVPHVDEAGRLCCINIGIKNSSSAITLMSNDGIRENFYQNNSKYILEDGTAYLVNTSNIHSVVSDSEIPRYLITYGFGITIEEILKKFNINYV